MKPSMPDSDGLLKHTGFLRALARSLLQDEGQVDDVVQDTWLAALHRPPAERSGLRWWLGAVARNVARQTRRPVACRPDPPILGNDIDDGCDDIFRRFGIGHQPVHKRSFARTHVRQRCDQR